MRVSSQYDVRIPLTIHFLNVGHGDCTVVEYPSGRISEQTCWGAVALFARRDQLICVIL
jgi:hypothetical protein